MRHCLRLRLDKNHALGGKMQVSADIGADGRVIRARDVGPDLSDRAVRQCVLTGLYALEVPGPRGPGSVTATFVFEPLE